MADSVLGEKISGKWHEFITDSLYLQIAGYEKMMNFENVMGVRTTSMMPVLEKILKYESAIKYLESDACFPLSIWKKAFEILWNSTHIQLM